MISKGKTWLGEDVCSDTLISQWFRLENRSVNRSHKDEMPGNGKIQKIKDEMELFLKQREN